MPLALAALLSVSCSNEDAVKNEQAASSKSLFAKGSQDFTKLLDNFYGVNYKLGADKIVTDADAAYTVTSVNVSGVAKPVGYIVNTPNEIFYYGYDEKKGTLTEYTPASFSPVGVYDLTKDPNYNPITFDPYTPPKNGTKKFWGTEVSYGSISHDINGNGCYTGVFETHYVFWFNVNDGPKMKMIVNERGNYVQQTVAVDCETGALL